MQRVGIYLNVMIVLCTDSESQAPNVESTNNLQSKQKWNQCKRTATCERQSDEAPYAQNTCLLFQRFSYFKDFKPLFFITVDSFFL